MDETDETNGLSGDVPERLTRGNYRAAVGPEKWYDTISSLQFCILTRKFGMREKHTLCDIGCGSLRGGRLFISYLQPHHYFGIEPHEVLVQDGIANELGEDFLHLRTPTFHISGDFDLTWFETSFDYILAQSIFSHAAGWQIETCMREAKKCLNPDGYFIATYFKGRKSYEGDEWRDAPVVRYTASWMRDMAKSCELTYVELTYPHPSRQTWFVMRHAGAP